MHDGLQPNLYLLSFDTSTLAMLSAADLGFDEWDGRVQTHMAVWGLNGVAFNRLGLKILSGSFLAPPQLSSSVKKKAIARFDVIHVQ